MSSAGDASDDYEVIFSVTTVDLYGRRPYTGLYPYTTGVGHTKVYPSAASVTKTRKEKNTAYFPR
jgi:hypothetical protein